MSETNKQNNCFKTTFIARPKILLYIEGISVYGYSVVHENKIQNEFGQKETVAKFDILTFEK